MSEVKKPVCICGEIGVFKVLIEVAELQLSHGRWDPAYPPTGSVTAIMCAACVKLNVSLSTKIQANVVTEN